MRVRSALLRPGLVRLLTLLLLLQWGTAFAHCLNLAAPASGLAVEICTAEGIHRVVLPAEDGDGPRHEASGTLSCPACLGPGALALPAPEVALAPPLLLAQAADPPPPPAPAPQPPRSCQPRAPPTS